MAVSNRSRWGGERWAHVARGLDPGHHAGLYSVRSCFGKRDDKFHGCDVIVFLCSLVYFESIHVDHDSEGDQAETERNVDFPVHIWIRRG